MHIQPLSIEQFNNFQKTHKLSNLYQTINYAMLKAENSYDYELVGLVDENNNILACSLILIKPIGIKSYYGYAPRGFLLDYDNEYLVKTFTEELRKYFLPKDVVFIKLNPNIIIGEVDKSDFTTKYNENKKISETIPQYGYKKLADNLYFEAKLPRYNAIIDLKEFKTAELNKNTRNKIKKGLRKGLKIELVDKNKLNIFYDIIKNNIKHDEFYYQDYYTVFSKNNAIDLFLVSIDYDFFLKNSQYIYNVELERNNKLNEKLTKYNEEKNINAKMASDKILLSYKNDIMEATKGLIDNKKDIYIAGGLVIKHNDTASIIVSSFDKNYKRFVPNYFLYYSIIKYYQKDFKYLDLNGVVGNFTQENPYTGLNRFKFGFNPHIYEYIGEYDLIINERSYEILLHNGALAKEFNKSAQ